MERIERKGLSFARNRGIGLARGEYLFFMDDDAVLARNAVKVLRDAAGAGDTAAICGQVVELETGRPYVLNYPRLARQTLGWRDFQRFAGSCHAVSRKTFDKIGLYDERFGVGGDYPAGEETDLFYRLLEAGEQVRYVPELVVHHPSARGFTLEKIFAYAFGNGALHAKHAWMNGLVPRHYRSFIRLLLVNCMKLIIGICVRLEWDRVAWTKAAGNIRGYIDYVSKRTDRCNLDHSKRIGLV